MLKQFGKILMNNAKAVLAVALMDILVQTIAEIQRTQTRGFFDVSENEKRQQTEDNERYDVFDKPHANTDKYVSVDNANKTNFLSNFLK